MVDLQPQNELLDNGANVFQLVRLGTALFKQVPPTSRTFLLLGVTDLKTIQFLGMTRRENNTFSYQLSDIMGNVLEVLCSILASTDGGVDDARGHPSVPPQFGVTELPHLTFKGQRLQLTSVLGLGATSTVYGCKLGEQQLAAKVPNNPLDATSDADGPAAQELTVLRHLSACRGIVELVGVLDGDRGFLLQPVGKALVRVRESLETLRVFEGMEGLVRTIRSVHELGVVHGDLRTSNLLVVKDKDSIVVLIMDW